MIRQAMQMALDALIHARGYVHPNMMTADDIGEAIAALRSSIAEDGWRLMDSAPKNGLALVYRPLADNSIDEPIAIKQMTGINNPCWRDTVPKGQQP